MANDHFTWQYHAARNYHSVATVVNFRFKLVYCNRQRVHETLRLFCPETPRLLPKSWPYRWARPATSSFSPGWSVPGAPWPERVLSPRRYRERNWPAEKWKKAEPDFRVRFAPVCEALVHALPAVNSAVLSASCSLPPSRVLDFDAGSFR